MNTLLDNLEEAALLASPGQWTQFYSKQTHEVHHAIQDSLDPIIHWTGFEHNKKSDQQNKFNASFIAQANPYAILKIIALVREQERELINLKVIGATYCVGNQNSHEK